MVNRLKKVTFITSIFLLGVFCSSFYFKAFSHSDLKVSCFPSFSYLGYHVVYNSKNRVPLYTYEKLTEKNLKKEADRNQVYFSENTEIYKLHRSRLSDYVNSGFDRGHMAAAANQTFAHDSLKETFLLSNICPQNSVLNRGLWSKLERSVRAKVNSKNKVEVLTGPLFLPQSCEGVEKVAYQVIGKNKVAVPTHFFKVVYVKDKKNVELFCYLIPNQSLGLNEKVENYQISLSELEKLSGLQIKRK